MKDEKPNKEESNSTPESNEKHKMSEEILNEIEQQSQAEGGENLTEEESKEGEEGMWSKMGLGKKDKHKKEVKELNDKIAELNDKYLRLVAEFDNFKKRNAKERIEFFRTAGQDVIVSLLPTMDDFYRAIKLIESAKDVTAVKEGLFLIFDKLNTTLESRGLKPMESIGKEFNPELHDAITEVPAASEDMKGKVVDEIEKGYFLNDKIIRHAKVIVGK